MSVTIIKNATMVNPENITRGDILIREGIIEKVDQEMAVPSKAQIIDAKGMYVIPGGIDPHVHLHLPTPAGFSSDDFRSGSRAALSGGTTTICDFVTPHRGQSLTEALKKRREEARASLIDYALHLSPVEWRDSTESELRKCVEEEGITSLKVYMAYRENIGLGDDELEKVLALAGELGVTVLIHCEMDEKIEELKKKFIRHGKTSPLWHAHSRPPETEWRAVDKAISLAKRTNCPVYIVHVSTGKSLEIIRRAKKDGQQVYAETCPQYLLFDDSEYDQYFYRAAPFVISPPLRKPTDVESLWEGVSDGTIDSIGTDHCPFFLNGQKDRGKNDFTKIPNGAGGIEYRTRLLYHFGVLKNRITLQQFVQLTSTNPSRIFGFYPKKGVIREGSDADLVIWNPETDFSFSKNNMVMNCDHTIYDGIRGKGWMQMVFCLGEQFPSE